MFSGEHRWLGRPIYEVGHAIGAIAAGAVLTLGVSLAVAAPISSQNAAPDLGAAESPLRFTLDNGVRVRLLPVEGTDALGVIAGYGVGFFADPVGSAQLAHLVEHLRVTGAVGDAPANAVWDRLNALGGTNAETQASLTYYDFAGRKSDLEAILRAEADRLTELAITEADLSARMADPRNRFGGMKYEAAFAEETTRLYKQSYGEAPAGI
jgi:hypothetical protein